MKNLDKKQILYTHSFGSGLKYMEQWLSGSLYSAMMILLTDTTSLGCGGGDFHLDCVPLELAKFIVPVIGSWAGDRVVFSGDYTEKKEYEETDKNGEEVFFDVSTQTALALWAMIACHVSKYEFTADKRGKLLVFMKEAVSRFEHWEHEENFRQILDEIDALVEKSEASASNATKKRRLS